MLVTMRTRTSGGTKFTRFLLVAPSPRGESAKKLRPPLKFTASISH
jgi:hypothetical protein